MLTVGRESTLCARSSPVGYNDLFWMQILLTFTKQRKHSSIGSYNFQATVSKLSEENRLSLEISQQW